MNGAPPCQYAEARNPPMEIRDQPTVSQYGAGCGFVSFVLFAEHVKSDAKASGAMCQKDFFVFVNHGYTRGAEVV